MNDMPNFIVPAKLHPLFDTAKRYKFYAIHGGRYSTKSHTVGKRLLQKAISSTRRVLCTREIQKTIRDSVHRLLTDLIEQHGLREKFDVTENEIKYIPNGSFFSFRGLKTDPQGIKSAEGYDDCWVEEAHNISAESWDNLIPTIRKHDSEFYIVWNDNTEDDEVYKRFVTVQRDDVLAIKINYTDIPKSWIPPNVMHEIEWDMRSDLEKYKHVWLGEPTGYSGRIYPMYKDAIHIHNIDLVGKELAKCDCYMAIDPHRKFFPFISWWAVTPDNKLVCYNEYPTLAIANGKYYDEIRNELHFIYTHEQLANIMKICDWTEFGAIIKSRIPDPRFVAENTEWTLQLAPYGIGGWQIPPMEKIETQRDALKQLLSYDTQQVISALNQPDLYVCDWCHNVRRALSKHCWDESKEGREMESERFKDPIDTIRYLLAVIGKPLNSGPATAAEEASKKTSFADYKLETSKNYSEVSMI